MWLKQEMRRRLGRLLTRQRRLVLAKEPPHLEGRFAELGSLGLYLHVPFCRQICPYCPYSRQLFEPDLAESYARAVIREIDLYADLVGDKPVTSFYIGGGTPTTMLHHGLDRMLEHIFARFNMQCDIHMESHPNDLTPENLRIISSLGVRHLSIGVEALQDRHLKTLHRPYTVAQVKEAVARAVGAGFDCVNVDAIFALPDQTLSEVDELGRSFVELGVDQVAAYPLYEFPYTRWEEIARHNGYKAFGAMAKRRMLAVLESIFYGAGFRRTSVWAFTRHGVPKYCSVTVPLYLGLGAAGGTYLKDVFYFNSFDVPAYVAALDRGRLPIALSLELSEPMQMAGWLYWRLYETRFRKSDFCKRFGRSFDEVYGRYIRPLALLGLVRQNEDEVVCTHGGSYWLHWIEDLFSIDYISSLWGICSRDPWPEGVVIEV